VTETPINLNKVRKIRARAANKAQADLNSVAFGRTKAERTELERETSRMARDLDGKAMQTPPTGANQGTKKT